MDAWVAGDVLVDHVLSPLTRGLDPSELWEQVWSNQKSKPGKLFYVKKKTSHTFPKLFSQVNKNECSFFFNINLFSVLSGIFLLMQSAMWARSTSAKRQVPSVRLALGIWHCVLQSAQCYGSTPR